MLTKPSVLRLTGITLASLLAISCGAAARETSAKMPSSDSPAPSAVQGSGGNRNEAPQEFDLRVGERLPEAVQVAQYRALGGIVSTAYNAYYTGSMGKPARSWSDFGALNSSWPLLSQGIPWPVIQGSLVSQTGLACVQLPPDGDPYQLEVRLELANPDNLSETWKHGKSPLKLEQSAPVREPELDALLLAQDPDQTHATRAGGLLTPVAHYCRIFGSYPTSPAEAFELLQFALIDETVTDLYEIYPSIQYVKKRDGSSIGVLLHGSTEHTRFLLYHEAKPGNASIVGYGYGDVQQPLLDAYLNEADVLGEVSDVLQAVPRISASSLRASGLTHVEPPSSASEGALEPANH